MGKCEKYPIPTVCEYCGHEVVLTSNAEIYGSPYGNGKCYLCRNCRASVGVHPDLVTPLGRLANKELKKLKMKVHSLFDPYWKNESMKRAECYLHLSNKLGIALQECHFGWFGNDMLLKVISILENEGLQ